ncbi:MAG: bifunctional nuclease family protein [Acidobacteriota bacterium]
MSEEGFLVMKIGGLVLDPDSEVPIVVLRDEEGDNLLPIWIGPYEANAIAMAIEDIDTPRPMTHDLLTEMIHRLQAEVLRILIVNLEESTYFATIELDQGGDVLTVDSRPSDAIAIALRTDAPILVAQSVLKTAQGGDSTPKLTDEEKLKKWLEEVNPEDLGKYEM